MTMDDEEQVDQASLARRERLKALRAAKEFSMADESGDMKATDEDEDPIEQAAAERRERLRSLRMAKELTESADGEAMQTSNNEDISEEAEESNRMPNLKFRNYLPHDNQLQEGKLAPVTLPKYEDPIAAEPLQPEKDEDPFLNIAPKKPNWDLRRDIQKKLDKLERRTTKAIIEIMQEQEKEKIAQELKDGAAED